MKTKFRPEAGFTLMEIMVVVVIIGLLAVLILPKFVGRTTDARISKAKSDIQSLSSALQLYFLDNNRYPTTEQGLKSLVASPEMEPKPKNWRKGGYLAQNKISKDPWGHEYVYVSPGVTDPAFEIVCYGEDGQEGGLDAASDIKSWELVE